ncbi:MAG: hypothetical protein HUJ25_10890 [Crocinitomicaceae bacterium]|nr:hypothetical protein [Crocinitomicaceae bacterium]
MKSKALLILTFIFSFGLFGYSQVENDTTKVKVVKIVRHDGVEYVGEIIKDDGREVLIRTKNLGDIYIPKSEIASITELKKEDLIAVGNLRVAGPFATRYYFTNNALPIKKGEDYAMLHLYGPEVHFSVADNLSIGVMATWIAAPIGVAAKYSIPIKEDKLYASVGTIMFSSGYLFQAKGWGGLHWGSITFGRPGKNITLSSGFGYVDLIENNRSNYEVGLQRLNRGSVSSVGMIFPVGKKASFIFDSMVSVSERRNYMSYGGSWDSEVQGYQYDMVTYDSGTQISSFIMPGMRFQNKESRAFQVALAGVFHYSSIGFSNGDTRKLRSFPVPMCSWFFKF